MEQEQVKELASKVRRLNDMDELSARLEVAKAFNFTKTILRFEHLLDLYQIEGMMLQPMAILRDHWTRRMIEVIEIQHGADARQEIAKALNMTSPHA